jgi:hypothetical protein
MGSTLIPDQAVRNGLPAMHLGELLRDNVLPALRRMPAGIAQLLGVSRQSLHGILPERALVTPEMALCWVIERHDTGESEPRRFQNRDSPVNRASRWPRRRAARRR